MKRIIAILSVFTLLLSACDKPYQLDLPLAVTSRNLSLTKDGGSTHVLVYSTGHWTAHFTHSVNWASLSKVEGDGNTDLVFDYSANYSIARKVGIALEMGEHRDTVWMTQAGAITEPSFILSSSSVNLINIASTVTLPMSTNMLYGYEDTECKILYEDDEEWISNVVINPKNVKMDIAANTTGYTRSAYATFIVPDVTGKTSDLATSTIVITQSPDGAELKLLETEATYEGYANSGVVIPTASNNVWAYSDRLSYDIDCGLPEGETPWIKSVSMTSDGLKFSLLNNPDGLRTGKITVTFLDEGSGQTVSQTYTVNQKKELRSLDFTEVRAMAPGAIDTEDVIEGFIVSDRKSLNVSQPVQTGQFKYDFTENERTAYLESLDGKYGFCLKYDVGEIPAVDRFSKVKIILKGLTLEKVTTPAEMYFLKGVSTTSFAEVQEPDESALPVKSKGIRNLTDDDIFTLVSVPGLEIMCKDGSWTNCTEGYCLKCDVNPYSGITNGSRWTTAPLMMSDCDGNSISALTECTASWRRGLVKATYDMKFGSLLPQGSGVFKGVVVAEQLQRYNMESVGKYQLRAMQVSDVNFNDPAFSKTIVEWNWNDKKADVIPEIGDGTITATGSVGLATAAASDFNNLFPGLSGDGGNGGSTSNQKGLANSCALKFTGSWWDFTNNVGNGLDITFSTAGLTGTNMVFGIVWGHGAMGDTTLDSPAHWNLLYSIDGGTTFKKVEGNLIKNRSIVWWTTTTQDATPGFQEYLRKLPVECLGKDKVILRLQVADKVTDAKGVNAVIADNSYVTNLGIEKGTLTNKSTEIRIGTITVRYN